MNDTARLLARLRAIDEEEMFAFPHLCEQAVKEAIFKIESLEKYVAELEAEADGFARQLAYPDGPRHP
jgi:hypothetical protein